MFEWHRFCRHYSSVCDHVMAMHRHDHKFGWFATPPWPKMQPHAQPAEAPHSHNPRRSQRAKSLSCFKSHPESDKRWQKWQVSNNFLQIFGGSELEFLEVYEHHSSPSSLINSSFNQYTISACVGSVLSPGQAANTSWAICRWWGTVAKLCKMPHKMGDYMDILHSKLWKQSNHTIARFQIPNSIDYLSTHQFVISVRHHQRYRTVYSLTLENGLQGFGLDVEKKALGIIRICRDTNNTWKQHVFSICRRNDVLAWCFWRAFAWNMLRCYMAQYPRAAAIFMKPPRLEACRENDAINDSCLSTW